MNVIEQHLAPKTGDLKNCEDALVVTDDFACVIDGTTSKSYRLWAGKKSGIMAALLITEAVKNLPAKAKMQDAIEHLTGTLAEHYHTHGIYEELEAHPMERFTASVALYSQYHKEIWLIGDCQAMIDDDLYANKLLIEDALTSARALYLEIQLLNGEPIEELIRHDTGREFIKPLLEGQSLFQNAQTNSPYAYASIDGFEVNPKGVTNVKIKSEAKNLILATDGYPFLRSSLSESEEALKALLETDPLCMRVYKSTKGLQSGNISYDDRAFIKLEL